MGVLSKVKERFNKVRQDYDRKQEIRRAEDAELNRVRKETEWKARVSHEKWRVREKYRGKRKSERSRGGSVSFDNMNNAIWGSPPSPAPTRKQKRRSTGGDAGLGSASDSIFGSERRSGGGDLFGLDGAEDITGVGWDKRRRR